MQITVIGASGLSGRPLLSLASERGIRVKALARKPLSETGKGVETVIGSPTDPEAVKKSLEGSDALVVTLGMNLATNAKGGRNPFGKMQSPLDLFSKAAEVYLPIAKAAGVKRIVYLSAYGVGAAEYKTLPLIFRIIIRLSAIKHAYHDHEKAEALVKASGLDATILHPGFLTEEDRIHEIVRVAGADQGGISRKTIAAYILDILASGADRSVTVSMFGPKKK